MLHICNNVDYIIHVSVWNMLCWDGCIFWLVYLWVYACDAKYL